MAAKNEMGKMTIMVVPAIFCNASPMSVVKAHWMIGAEPMPRVPEIVPTDTPMDTPLRK